MHIRYACRSLLAAPAFTLGSIFCLSLGLALTIAAFSMINASMFGALPGVRDRGTLRNVWLGTMGPNGRSIHAASSDDYQAYKTGLAEVADVAATTSRAVSMQYGSTSHAARAVYVSPNYFALLGTVPQLGGNLDRSAVDVVVISDPFWRAHMGAREDAVGQLVRVDGRPYTVGAVAPPKFNGTSPGEFEDEPERVKHVWLPLAALPANADADPTGRWLTMIARVKPAVSDALVQARADAVAAGLASADPARHRGAVAQVRPTHSGAYGDASDIAIVAATVMIIPFGILAIACANVANLLLARGAARAREIAVRLALGASRRRIVTELLVESALVSGAAAAVALALCAALISMVEQWMPMAIPVDWRIAVFALAAAVVTAFAFGLLPALSASRAPMIARIQDARPVRPRTRRLLVAVQFALSTTLLVVAALIVRTVITLTHARETADEAHVVTASFDLRMARYDQARGEAFVAAVTERVRTLPGVQAAGSSSDAPFRPYEAMFFWKPEEPRDRRVFARGGAISENWLQAAGLRIIAGRDFLPHERRGTPSVTLVSETLAKRFWPGETALGRTLIAADPRVAKAPRYELRVVGVADDGITHMVEDAPSPMAYLPAPVTYVPIRTLWVRTDGSADRVMPQLRSIMNGMAPELPVKQLMTVAEARTRQAGPYRWLANGMAGAGLLSLLLAGLGLFALLSYLVAQRRREVGIRMALGARRIDIIRLIVGESAWVAIGGALAGSFAAAIIATFMRTDIAALSPTDPLSFATAAAVLITASLAASAHPALRASRTNPSEVLRAE